MEKFTSFSAYIAKTASGLRRAVRGKLPYSEFCRIAYQAESPYNRVYSNPTWQGATDFETARRIQREGYIPEGGAIKLPVPMDFAPQVYMERAMVGQIPDPDAWLRGEPEAMYNLVQVADATPTIHLACMMNVTAGIKATEQQKHADEVFRCIRGLQNAGNQVTLTALFYNDYLNGVTTIQGRSHTYSVEELQVELLREGQVLSPATLGAVFHLSFYRIGWFGWSCMHAGGEGGSIKPPDYVDDGKRIVIPSFEFLKTGETVTQYVSRRIQEHKKLARAV